MSIADEARAEAERIISDEMSAEAITGALPFKVGFMEGAAWLASRKPEAAPSEREALTAIRDAYDRTMDMRPACDDDFYAAVQEALNRVCDSDGNFITPEAAPSDTDREALIAEARRWNDFIGNPLARNRMTNGECSIAVKAIEKVLTSFEEVLSRSQPVQVEVTDDMVEKAARALWAALGDNGEWDDGVHSMHEQCRADARAALLAALGGGDQ